MKIKEQGFSNRYLNTYYTDVVVECDRVSRQYEEDLGLEQLAILFFSFILEVVVAFVLLLVEMLNEKYWNIRRVIPTLSSF
jgi:hypothetical protein